LSLKIIGVVIVVTLTPLSIANALDKGIVQLDHYDCPAGASDRIVIETRRGYTLAEVYSGYSATHSGKVIYGEFHSYGFKEIYDEDDENGDNEVGRIYIDDYMASRSEAIRWCKQD